MSAFVPPPSHSHSTRHVSHRSSNSSDHRSNNLGGLSPTRKMSGKADYDALSLIKANASIIYPQYPPNCITAALSTMTRKDGRLAFYVAVFALLPDTSGEGESAVPGVPRSAPRLLETGPPKMNVPDALESMLEGFLGRDVARVVNEQASVATKVPRKEAGNLGYTFLWGDGHVPTVSNPNRDPGPHPEPPPAYED